MNALFYLGLTLISLYLRIPHLSPLAVIGSDGSEYIYCVEKEVLPHSPYVLYLWMGFLLHQFVRLDWGYTGLSLVCSLVSTILFGRVIECLYKNRYAGWLAATVFTLLPVSIRYAGLQEVYAVQIFLIILACWALVVRSSAFGFGLALGAAITTHNGSLFAFPALFLLFRQRRNFLNSQSHQASSRLVERSIWSRTRKVFLFPFRRTQEAFSILYRHLTPVRLTSPAWWTYQSQALETQLEGWVQEEQTPFRNLAKTIGIRSLDRAKAFHASKPHWANFLAGFLIPQVIVLSWLIVIWIEGHGIRNLPLLLHFLRGVAPTPAAGEILAGGWWTFWWVRMVNTWTELTKPEVLGLIPLQVAVLLLLLTPLRKALAWWLLAIPYLVYETMVGYSLDMGIYLVFVAPAMAASFSMGLSCWSWSRKWPLNLIRTALSVAGMVGLIQLLPAFQATSEIRNLYPWYRERGSTKVLADWVRDHSPPDSLVIQPIEWHYGGLASALYTDRIPLFHDSGGMLQPGLWKPLFCHPVFDHVRTSTTRDFEQWLDVGRPILSFDSDPFHGLGSYWPQVDVDRFEARPILWLDRNQTGTSEMWRNTHLLASVDMGNATAMAPYQVTFPPGRIGSYLRMQPFYPTLYRIARKTDPPEPPSWVTELQALVPESQRTPPAPMEEEGITVIAREGGDNAISLTLPSIPGRDHVLRQTLNSEGWEFAIECQVKTEQGWVPASRDMERILGYPDAYFTFLYFHIPAHLVKSPLVEVRLLPVLGTPSVNAFFIAWGVDKG